MTRATGKYEPPDGPGSVGWTRPQWVTLADASNPFALQSGRAFAPVKVEYETYGELSPARDNAILVTHALSGDAHAAGWDAAAAEMPDRAWRQRKPGWWDTAIGPGKPLDTRRFFVICANVLGSCYGSTGPSSPDPAGGQPYGLRFPTVTIGDWVRLQARLLDHLGVERLYAVVGGSLGGQQALEWALAFPDRVARAIVLAAAPRLSAQGLAFNAVGRYSILNDPHFQNGDYYGGRGPRAGLAAARMLAHITYLSEPGMHRKFGRNRRAAGEAASGAEMQYEVESYLMHQGRSFVERFDANSYLYITRAMDDYDAAAQWGGGDLVAACRRITARALVVSFSSDWLYPPAHCRELAMALCRAGRAATYVDVPSQHGHDAFLVETETLGRLLRSFLAESGA